MTHVSINIGKTRQSGYILLLSILIIGVICSAILSSTLLIGANTAQVTLVVQHSSQALSLAQGCAEYAMHRLRTSLMYAGSEILTYPTGSCEVLTIGGVGNTNRFICTESDVNNVVRRMEIVVKQILPQTTIYSWQEVALFTLCE